MFSQAIIAYKCVYFHLSSSSQKTNKQEVSCSSLFKAYKNVLIFHKIGRHVGSHHGCCGPHHDSSKSRRFSFSSDVSLTMYGMIFSEPLMHTDTPSRTVGVVPYESIDSNMHNPRRYSVVFFHIRILHYNWVLTESRIPLKPVFGSVRIVARSISSYEQTQ